MIKTRQKIKFKKGINYAIALLEKSKQNTNPSKLHKLMIFKYETKNACIVYVQIGLIYVCSMCLNNLRFIQYISIYACKIK